jgi:hypothetical protein
MSDIKLFETKKVRTHWDEEKELWYFSVQDVVEALTDSADVKQYIKKLRSRDPELFNNWGTICTSVEMIVSHGKRIQTIQDVKKREPSRSHDQLGTSGFLIN